MKHSITRPNCPGRQQGVTLIELMVGIAIMGVLLMLGVPSFQSALQGNRLATTTNDLVGSLATTRSEALRRGGRVTLCKSANGTQCTTAGNWSQGWIIFVDTTRATDASVDSGETILARVEAANANIVLVGNSGVVNYVSYGSDGSPRLMNGTSQSGTLRVCNSSLALADARRARDVQINAAGRVTTTTPASVSTACAAAT